MLLLQVGRAKEACEVLQVAARYVKNGTATGINKSHSEDYPHYPLMWICWAATEVGWDNLAEDCFRGLSKYQHRLTESGLVKDPYFSCTDFEADFLATAGESYCVLQSGRGQLHSMLGFPAMVLLELARVGGPRAKAYRQGATELLMFLKGCGTLSQSSAVHVVAPVAA